MRKMSFLKLTSSLLITFGYLGNFCESLELYGVREGPCFPSRPDPSFNLTWYTTTAANWRYLVAGSKYDMYNTILGHPQFENLRDYEFYYNSCIRIGHFDPTAGTLNVTSFGGEAYAILENLKFESHGIFTLDMTPLPRPGLRTQQIRHYLTLTDNESFIFMHKCIGGTDRGFTVASTKPVLDAHIIRKIEKHALSLGYRREHIVLWKRDTCRKESEAIVELEGAESNTGGAEEGSSGRGNSGEAGNAEDDNEDEDTEGSGNEGEGEEDENEDEDEEGSGNEAENEEEDENEDEDEEGSGNEAESEEEDENEDEDEEGSGNEAESAEEESDNEGESEEGSGEEEESEEGTSNDSSSSESESSSSSSSSSSESDSNENQSGGNVAISPRRRSSIRPISAVVGAGTKALRRRKPNF